MAGLQNKIFSTIPASDPLHFWENQETNYERVKDFLELNTDELSKLSGLSKKSIRLDARIPADLKERMEQIAIICSLVAEYFGGDPYKTGLWFKTPNPMLGDVTPRDMIRFGRYKKLLKFIIGAREGDEENTGSIN